MKPPTRAAHSAHEKPAGCSGCTLASRGHGFVPADGPPHAPILLFGEAPGYDEAAVGRPFVGAAGSMLERILRRNAWGRANYRIANTIQCVPPKLYLDGAPWQADATAHCRQYVDPVFDEPHQVVVPMGASALKRVLGLSGTKGVRVQDFHGTVTRDPSDRFWVVPTYHPSFLQRGAHNMLGTVSFDLQRAHEVAAQGWTGEPIDTIEDPPVEWFAAWVDNYLAAVAADPEGVWLAVDIETPDKAGGKDEGELGSKDQSYQILRINLACHPDEGVTVPFEGGYLPVIRKALESSGVKVLWNDDYDLPRLGAASFYPAGPLYDFMWGWHLLQSDLPRGLGFVAPFYSRFGAWKHLSGSRATYYAALDGPQTLRCAFGISRDLQLGGQWDTFLRHVHLLKRLVLAPAQTVGLGVDRPALEAFAHDLDVKARRLLHDLQGLVPDSVRPLTPKDGLTHPPAEGAQHPQARTVNLRTGAPLKSVAKPIKQDLFAQTAVVVERLIVKEVLACTACGAVEIQRRHRCADKTLVPSVTLQVATVTRWFWQEPFSPDSPKQILAAILSKGHKPGKSKTSDESTDRKTLEGLAKRSKDPFYPTLLQYRAVGKVKGTYADGTLARLDVENRIHPQATFKPSTQRLSYTNPNITNVVSRDAGKESLAAGFRACITAGPDCRLLEVDFSGIEAVLTGWFARDPIYIRLAKLGVHAALASHVLDAPYDPRWDDHTLAAFLKAIKARAKGGLYDRCKRVVHGSGYGLTPYGMQQTYSEMFPTVKSAAQLQETYFAMAPGIPQFQAAMQRYAYDHGSLGGPVPSKEAGWGPGYHPFAYKHWFWAVTTYQPISEAQRIWRVKHGQPWVEIQGKLFAVQLGEDAKRVIAFFPQSTAAGILKEALLALLSSPDHPLYIGDAYFGRTPLRAPIHDSLLLEVPHQAWDRVVERVYRAMLAPIRTMPCPIDWHQGPYLGIGVEGKAGANWAAMEPFEEPGLAGEIGIVPVDPLDDDDVGDETEDQAVLQVEVA